MDSLNFDFEKSLWDEGLKHLAGFDEVGRGAFAGPLLVGCVGFRSDVKLPSSICLHDSKKLTQRAREMTYRWIISNSSFYGIGQVENDYIDEFGMTSALYKARQLAYDQATKRVSKGSEIDMALVDGRDSYYVEGLAVNRQKHIIGGDATIATIAAASILAKVTRDALMRSYSLLPRFEVYNWAANKGYGTAIHREAIRKHGLSTLHRKDFVKNYVV